MKIIQKRNLWFTLSLIVIISGLGLLSFRAITQVPVLNFGIDFTGGSSFLLRSNALVLDSEISDITIIQETREVLEKMGLEKSRIQITTDRDMMIRCTQLSNDARRSLLLALSNRFGEIELLEADIIGPTIGAELREQSLWIILAVSIALLFYITWRFEWVYGLAALTAVLHDALIVIAFSAFLGVEINTAFVAAILTVLGYSINDTIVIFDRIRELARTGQYKGQIAALLNTAITQMITRSIHTSVTTLIVISALLVLGGSTIKSFALVLLIGVIAGTYSSIFIASPVLYLLLNRYEEA